MRICYVGDTGSVHTQRWVRWFAAKHEVAVISSSSDDHLAEYTIARLPTASRRGTRLLSSARTVRRAVHEYRPDVLHCHYINEAGWLGASTQFHPFVVTAWGSDLYRAPSESRLAGRLNPWAVRAADWVTCDSFDQAALIRSWGVAERHVSVIGWGVDRDEFNPGVDGKRLRGELGIPDDAPVLLSPRRWYPNSNIPAIIAAHAQLPQSTYLIVKSFAGRGQDGNREIVRAIAASPARDRIKVVGDLSQDRLPTLYAAADIVLSLCVTDGTPASVLEAMALGRPVIAYNNPSLAERVSGPGGRLVSSVAPPVIAAAVHEFLDNPEAIAGAVAHNVEVIAERADRRLEFERMEGIYRQLVASGSGSNGHGR